MFGTSDFYELVSGRRRGPAATLARGVLRATAVPYGLGVNLRNWHYDRGQGVRRVDLPVIGVGNLTLGGTGKTPMVKWVAQWLIRQGLQPAIVSRGYKAPAGQANDEALELAECLPGVAHVENVDRVAGVREAMVRFRPDAVLLDDGFQHRRLARDLDIVLLDALAPFGFDHLFPRGTLREPVASLRRAGVICLARSDMVDADLRQAIRQRAMDVAPGAAWCEAAHVARTLLSATGHTAPLEHLHGQPVAAFSGIGNPSGFRHTLEAAGARIVGWREYPDHHAYGAGDLRGLAAWAEQCRAATVVCTHKDLVKVRRDRLGKCPLRAVVVEMQIRSGEEQLAMALAAALGKSGEGRAMSVPRRIAS